jgi:hypothetical protein
MNNMSMYEWAEQECRIACKKENPKFDFDSDEFDYGCSCYKSALKAYKSLCEDGHSGLSFGFTKNILIRLMEGQPLTPIRDEDFFSVERGTENHPLEADEYLKERGLKSELQCPRMSSLFRTETLDGKVTYKDIDRAYYVNVECPSDTYSSWCGFIDDMFPITMPYVAQKGKYVIYEQTFLTDKKHGDFDTKGILYVITPSGEKVDLNIFRTEGDDRKWKDITKEEYEELLSRRIDPLRESVAQSLIWTLVSNSGGDDEIKAMEDAYKEIPQGIKDKWFEELTDLCRFFDNPDNWQYNTFGMQHALCIGDVDRYKEIEPLVKIADYLKGILEVVNTYGN